LAISRAADRADRSVPVPGESSEDLIAFLGRWRRDYPEPDDGLAEAIEESRRAVEPPLNPWD
jgi:hypothetical protein